MAYSDEPQVVKAPARRRWLWWAVPALLLLFGALLTAALSGPIHDWRKEHSVHGPNHGTVHKLKLEGVEHAVELARNSDARPTFHFTPLPAAPEGLTLRYRLANGLQPEHREWKTMAFKPDLGVWVDESDRWHPLADFHVELRILRGEKTLWSGKRWAYGEADHHHH